ncbi:hypothetical protein ACS0TY_003197 [Phlomoides rotata]
MEKLKLLKKELKVWSRETFGSLQHKIETQREDIERLDRFNEVFRLEEDEVVERNKIGAELKRNMIWNEKFLFQKAKSNWLKEGDVNSKFFHGWINKRIKVNRLEGLLVNNSWVESKEGLSAPRIECPAGLGAHASARLGWEMLDLARTPTCPTISPASASPTKANKCLPLGFEPVTCALISIEGLVALPLHLKGHPCRHGATNSP